MLKLGGEAALISIARRSGRSTLQHLDVAKAMDSKRTIFKIFAVKESRWIGFSEDDVKEYLRLCRHV
jgi:hypothetical protein